MQQTTKRNTPIMGGTLSYIMDPGETNQLDLLDLCVDILGVSVNGSVKVLSSFAGMPRARIINRIIGRGLGDRLKYDDSKMYSSIKTDDMKSEPTAFITYFGGAVSLVDVIETLGAVIPDDCFILAIVAPNVKLSTLDKCPDYLFMLPGDRLKYIEILELGGDYETAPSMSEEYIEEIIAEERKLGWRKVDLSMGG